MGRAAEGQYVVGSRAADGASSDAGPRGLKGVLSLSRNRLFMFLLIFLNWNLSVKLLCIRASHGHSYA